MQELSKNYNPKEVEEKWLNKWLNEKHFASKSDTKNKENNFSIVLPPPNVTGSLHMGHAFGNTIQDVLIRYNKMNGKNVLWQAGTDHAGIGTQIVVEKELSKTEKKRKEDIGREEFLKRIWAWKEKHGNQIIDQMQKLGCAVDYDRLVFTMDENYTKAIRKVFTDLYNKKLIYKGKRIVNWCPKCTTSLSDLEVEVEEGKGKLYHILYPFDISDISKGGITVATSRPETLFGDVAVCVNPDDGRYKKLIGKKVFLPLINKQIPVIGDSAIEMDFGTGCLKVTPAHDSVDYEIYQRSKESKGDSPEGFNKAENFIQIMSPKGTVQDNDNLGIPSDINGLERFKAREITVQKLEELGLLKQVIDYNQPQSKHDRCGTVIEPYLSDQWYVKMKSLAEKAIAVAEGSNSQLQFIPNRYQDHYLNWLKNIKDWCISRQLWWGHQIPVWYKNDSDEIYVGEEPPEDIENYTQDKDVLDTWFSSALWPFVTLGWPEKTEYLKSFYPTSVLATAREIINLWVSRMVFMGLEFIGEIPFKNVLIHPVIQTPDGKRMSKSKGNAIDPLEMIEKYGADANRFWYFSVGVTGNQDVRFPGRKGKDGWESETLEQYRRFANKLWNASRFVIQNLDPSKTYLTELDIKDLKSLTIADKWILHKYTELISLLEKRFDEYKFFEIAEGIYKFTWDQYCDWYIEIAKKQMDNESTKEQTQKILFYILEGIIRALHPIMPFITEEIWNTLPVKERNTESILRTPYPKPDKLFLNDEISKSFTHAIETTREIRNLRQVAGIPWTKEIEARLFTQNSFEKIAMKNSIEYISTLTKSNVILVEEYKPVKPSTGSLLSDTRILIPLSGLIDLENMLSSLNKKKDKQIKEKETHELKLKNTDFIKNAPQDKIDEVKNRILEFENQIKVINEQIELLR